MNRKSIAVRCRRKIFLISGVAAIHSSYPPPLRLGSVYTSRAEGAGCVYKENDLVLKLHGNLSGIAAMHRIV